MLAARSPNQARNMFGLAWMKLAPQCANVFSLATLKNLRFPPKTTAFGFSYKMKLPADTGPAKVPDRHW